MRDPKLKTSPILLLAVNTIAQALTLLAFLEIQLDSVSDDAGRERLCEQARAVLIALDAIQKVALPPMRSDAEAAARIAGIDISANLAHTDALILEYAKDIETQRTRFLMVERSLGSSRGPAQAQSNLQARK